MLDWDFQNLTTAQKKAVFQTLILDNKYLYHKPHQPPYNKQSEFLLNFNDEVLYGGAAGGGKSDALLMAALMFVDYPKYNALLLRTQYIDLALPEGLIPRSHEWLDDTDAKWNESLHSWKFPSGSTLTFGYLATQNDVFRYKSAEFQFVGFEELTEFPREFDYTYLFSRMRKNVGSIIPIRMRATTNPDGVGADWVFNRFQPENPELRDASRDFILSLADDNPAINLVDYDKQLGKLDPVTRLQLRRGKWKVVREGNMFHYDWFNYIDAVEVPEKGVTIRFWDLAATAPKKGRDPDYTAGIKIKLYGGQYYVLDAVHIRVGPGEVEEKIKQTAEMDGKSVVIMIEQEPGASSKILMNDIARRTLLGYPFMPVKVTDSKMNFVKIFSAACYNKNVNIVRGLWNREFVDECCAFPTENIHDDQVDCASKCVAQLPVIPAIFSVDSDDEISFGKAVIVGKDYSKDWDDILSHDDVKFGSVIDIL